LLQTAICKLTEIVGICSSGRWRGAPCQPNPRIAPLSAKAGLFKARDSVWASGMSGGGTDRDRLAGLLDALDASASALRRDDCGDAAILGAHGHIHGPPEAFYLYLICHSPRAWTFAKQRLSFCRVSQDGDDEGILRLDRLPTSTEAAEIRPLLGIRKRMHFTPEELERRRAQALQNSQSWLVHSPK
jgi:hypothetical protein